ncbi:MAG: GspH/FimT family pseudopilin [Steroidobacteraceae bacterium]|jgi:type IV fimbrial biogenesis protein FimT
MNFEAFADGRDGSRRQAAGYPRSVQPDAGFTLIELLVTLTVGGILAAMAVPAFNSFVQNDRQVGQANSLVISFNYARAEAIKQNLAVGISVCPSANGTSCSGSNDWQGGWIVTTDPTGATPDATLQAVPALSPSTTLYPHGTGQTGVVFHSTGLVSAPVTINICDSRGAAYARDVELNATGRAATSQTPGQTVSGIPMSCS